MRTLRICYYRRHKREVKWVAHKIGKHLGNIFHSLQNEKNINSMKFEQ